MLWSCARLCRGGAALAVLSLPACGGTSKRNDLPGAQGGTAGSSGGSGAVAGAVSNGGATTGNGGAGAGGGTSIGGGGASGSATVPGGAAGASGTGPDRTPITSDCGVWPEDCEIECEVPIGGCLLDESWQLPPESLDVELVVTAVQTATDVGFSCSGPYGTFAGFGGDATELSLMTEGGTEYRLLFPAQMVAPERFPVGTSFEVSYAYQYFNPFWQEHELVVREAGEVVVFVLTSATNIAGSDIELETGEPSCPWSIVDVGACSEARFHTIARTGGVSVTDPCGSPVGDFTISSLSSGSREGCGAPVGQCDGVNRFVASGVRNP